MIDSLGTGNIEYIQGTESHSSNWGKYYIKGLEEWAVKEDGTYDRHQSYTDYQCNDVPVGTAFTIFEQSGNKRGTDTFYFTICVVDELVSAEEADYGSGKIAGNFKILLRAVGNTKAKRLMDWWIGKPAGVDAVIFAEHCAKSIDKRGQKDCPPMQAPSLLSD